MIFPQIFSLFVLSYVQIFTVHSVNYIHFEIEGSLSKKYPFNLTIFILNFKGIVIYAIDTKNNKLLVELEEENDKKVAIFKYNNYSIKETSKKICGCEKCEGIFMTLTLKLNQSKIIVHCNNANEKIINFMGSFKWPEQFHGYPIPRKISSTKKIFVWMGNIGPYNGYKDVIYLELKNQLVGCIHKVYYFDERVIIPNVDKSLFENSCKENIKYNKCQALKYHKLSNVVYNFEKDLFLTPGKSLTWNSQDFKTYGFQMGIEWNLNHTIFEPNSCLLEFIFREKSSVLVFIDDSGNISILIIKHALFGCVNDLSNSNIQKAQNILIDFKNNNLTIQIQKNETIISFLEEISFMPLKLTVGNIHRTNICTTFNGTIDVSYQINKKLLQKTIAFQVYNDLLSISIISIFILFSIIIGIVILVWNHKSESQVTSTFGTESNNYLNVECTNISLPICNLEIYEEIK